MVANPAIRNLIREGKAYQIPSTIQISKKDGMQSLDQSLKDLLMDGKISQEDAMKKAIDKKAFTESEQDLINTLNIRFVKSYAHFKFGIRIGFPFNSVNNETALLKTINNVVYKTNI